MKWNVWIAFQSRGRDRGNCLISYKSTQKLIDRGCEVFLTTIVATTEVFV